MYSTVDQMGRKLALRHPPQRIISLVPSQTELLWYLGLEETVVGITKFCVRPPEWFRSKQRVGGTKQLHYDRIEALCPDLIIGNKEENQKRAIEQLAQKYPVWMSVIHTLNDALDMMLQLGKITQKEKQAKQLQNQLLSDFQYLEQAPKTKPAQVVYLIWKNPYIVVAKNTFIDYLLTLAGFENCFAHMERYPQVTKEQIREANPDFIFLSSEPYPFKEKHINDFRTTYPNAGIELVDGEVFSWYGSRLLGFKPYVMSLRHRLLNNYN